MGLKQIVKAISARSNNARRQHVSEHWALSPLLKRKQIWDECCSGYLGRNIYDDKWREVRNHDVYLSKYIDQDCIKFTNVAGDLVDYVSKNYDESSIKADSHSRKKIEMEEMTMSNFFTLVDEKVEKFLYKLMGRNYWFREQPFIMVHPKNKARDHIQSAWHVDGFNQVTLQVLLEDNIKGGTATQFLSGSGNNDWNFNRQNITETLEDSYKITTCAGNKGDLFIINAGQALHRSYIGTGRKAIFINLSTGWYEKKYFGL